MSKATILAALLLLACPRAKAAGMEDAPSEAVPALEPAVPAAETAPTAIPTLEAPLAIQAASQAAAEAMPPSPKAQNALEPAAAAAQGPRGEGKAAAAAATLFDNAAAPDASLMAPAEGVQEISREISEPPELLRSRGIHATVTVYGSARIQSPEKARAAYQAAVDQYGRRPRSAKGKAALRVARQGLTNSRYYEAARRFGELVARGGKGRIALVTGGGPGIMEAANRGAFEAGGPSVGYNIKLPFEQSANPYITPGLEFDFDYFSSRKTSMRHGAVAHAYFPGGFGTMDELFELLTLMQTGKLPKAPIVLVGKRGYWDKILDFAAFAKMGLISQADIKLFHFAETAEHAWRVVSGHVARKSLGQK